MDDMNGFERRFADRVRAFATTGVESVDAAAVARAVAARHPRGARSRAAMRWRGLAFDRRTLAIAAVIGLLVTVVGGALLFGARLLPSPPPIMPGPTDLTVTTPQPTPSPLATAPGSTDCAEPPDEVRITEIDAPPYATGLQFAACSFWVASGGNGGGITRFDLATNTLTNISMHEVAGTTDEIVSGIATRGDEVWAIVRNAILVAESPSLVRIDPETNTIAEATALGFGGNDIVSPIWIVDDEAWIVSNREHGGTTAVLRILDITTRSNKATIELPQRSAEVLGFTSDSAWLRSSSENGWVTTRVDRQTHEPTPGTPAGECAFAEGGIICTTDRGEIHRISPDTNEIVHTVQLDSWTEGSLLVRSDGVDVWVLPIHGDAMTEMLQVDATTGEVVRRIPHVAAEPIDFSIGLGSIWLATVEKLLRFELPARP